ncbi:MFS transporter [Paenibacillus sedimenti]|uniref:MFS transporter n=1 Tax=Paenibacillus sedimenti TaxID=2770274 RepID=A0A926QL79_9BACL|nr:MFS transporter [Paenibacillus sedimenti]MBD0382573.1 MFS transporter [Paenibacillus sedimenti]
MLTLFKNRAVASILSSNVLLQLGIWIRNFAILLYVTEITNNDPLYVSLISVVEFAPIFLFSIIGGTFADRWRPKRTMVISDLLSALSVGAVLLAFIWGDWKAIFLATLVSSIMSQFSQPSALKLFKQHVSEEQLQSVMAMFQSLVAIFMVLGPIIGTFVYQRFGIEISIGVMGAMFLLSALVLTFLPKDKEKEASSGSTHFMRELADGFRYVRVSKVLKALIGTFIMAGLAFGLTQPLNVFVAIENLGKSKEFLQWMLMANGAAMLVGGGAVMAIAKKVSPQKLLAIGMFGSMITTIGVGLSENVIITMALMVLGGFLYPCIQTGINTLFLQNTEEAFVGRVNGVMLPMFMGFMVIGLSLSGILMKGISLLGVFTASGILFLAGALFLVPLFKLGRKETKTVREAPIKGGL